LDGTVEVTHPGLSRGIYTLEQLTKLHDGIEQLEDGMWDDVSDLQDGSDALPENDQVWLMDEGGTWQLHDVSNDSDEWEETDERNEVLMDVDNPWDAEPSVGPEHETSLLVSMPRSNTPRASVPTASTTLLQSVTPQTTRQASPGVTELANSILTDDEEGNSESHTPSFWKRFDVLSSAPSDHAFYSSPPAHMSKSFLGRLSREYRVLSNSLPGLYLWLNLCLL
jgi:ubiquitin-conjugating enzyme E2 O